MMSFWLKDNIYETYLGQTLMDFRLKFRVGSHLKITNELFHCIPICDLGFLIIPLTMCPGSFLITTSPFSKTILGYSSEKSTDSKNFFS